LEKGSSPLLYIAGNKNRKKQFEQSVFTVRCYWNWSCSVCGRRCPLEAWWNHVWLQVYFHCFF